MLEPLLLLIAAAGLWFVFDTLHAREVAVRIARRACREQGLQLLDDAVQGARLRFARDAAGVTHVRRTFVFEFSEDGFARRSGSLVMLGGRVESLQFEPYRFGASPPAR